MRRMNRMRPLKLEQLWIVPALHLGVVVMLLAQHPPQGSGWAVVAIGLVVGAAPETVWDVMVNRQEEWWCPKPWRAEFDVNERRPGGRNEEIGRASCRERVCQYV